MSISTPRFYKSKFRIVIKRSALIFATLISVVTDPSDDFYPVTFTPNTNSDIDYKWMDRALAQAKLAGKDVPVGSVLVLGDELLAEAHNQKEATQDPTDHAEIAVIRKATARLKNWRLTDATLYTTLEPCAMCAEAIIQCRIARLVFGAYDPKSGAVGSAFNLFVIGRIYPLPEIVGGIKEEDCQALLRQFFKERRTQVASSKT